MNIKKFCNIVKFDQTKLSNVKENFSAFHPSVNQMKLIYELSAWVAEKLEIEWTVLRTIYIQSLIKYQHLTQQFHFQNEDNLPQAKIVRSTEINKILVDEIAACLEEDTLKARKIIREIIEDVFAIYIEKYAGRDAKVV